MLPPETTHRLVLSHTMLAHYEAMGRDVGAPSASMVSNEIEILRALALLAPGASEMVEHLIERWADYATRNGLTLS